MLVPELMTAGHEVLGLARSDASAQALSAAGATVVRRFGWKPTHPSLLEDLEAGSYPASIFTQQLLGPRPNDSGPITGQARVHHDAAQ